MNKYLILFLVSFLFLSACDKESNVPVPEGVSNGGESPPAHLAIRPDVDDESRDVPTVGVLKGEI
ncbi:MAG: hypothetical protein OXJ52_05925 [Oligoflexia bacterium]|nr:hypothetical protein [Oligoflexia bacterium]